jgi:hypothetical protein
VLDPLAHVGGVPIEEAVALGLPLAAAFAMGARVAAGRVASAWRRLVASAGRR